MLPAARGCRPSGFPLCFSSVPCACCRCRSVRLSVPAAAVFLPLMISEKVYAVLASLFFSGIIASSICSFVSLPVLCLFLFCACCLCFCLFFWICFCLCLFCCPLLLSASPLPGLRCSPAGSPRHPLRTVRPFCGVTVAPLPSAGSRSDGCGLPWICAGPDCR